jgi:DNA polymerase III epsilon subunit-like protein
MSSNTIGRTVTYTSSNGYLITRKSFYGVKKGKSGGYSYDLSRVDGSYDGIGTTYFTTLARAKAYVQTISDITPNDSETPSSLDNLGIDFQSATMDASGTRLPTPGAFTGEFQKIMEGAKNWKEVQERLKGQTVTYFDFETTGIADYDGQDITNDPVQLGAVQVKDGKIVKRFNVYTNPESRLSEWSAKNLGRDVLDENGNIVLDENGKPTTTPVTPEWLAEQASQEQALRDFIDFIGPNALLGGQNVPFDVEILKRMADKYGIELDIAGTIDSKDLASLLPKYDPEKGIDGPKQIADKETGRMRASSSLGPVANFLGFEPANWHSADGDAEDSYNLVSKIIDRAANEDNQDLSLLDFPLMQKRYEERMAEFKSVVDPSNPTTDRQKKALEEFSNSDNPDIAQKANDALASATTRGDAANALADIHAQESLPSITVSESAAEVSQYNADESDPDFSSESSDQEALEEAYKELRAANRVQPMEPKSTADKKLNDDDYAVMDILRETMRNGSVIEIEDIKEEANANIGEFSRGGSLSKTIASLKRKGILTTVPDNKNRLALTESGLGKVAIVQAGFDKERRDAEERAAARSAEAEANIAAREAAKSPEQKEQEKLQQEQLDARNAARAQREEASRLFSETNLNSSDKNAIQLIDDDMFDDPSELQEGSTFDKSMFEDSLADMYEGEDLPEGETVSSLVSKTIASLQKKGILTTTSGDKSKLTLTENGAAKLNEYKKATGNVVVSELDGPEDSGTQTSGAPEFNSDESDSDFDDVEVEFDVPAQKATAPVGYSVVDGLIEDLTEKYGPTIAAVSAIGEAYIIKLGRLANEVNEAANNYKQTQDAGDKKLYMDKLLQMLDLRAGIILKANNNSLSKRNSVADSKLSGDPLLSTGELALINSKITPRNELGQSDISNISSNPYEVQRRRETSVATLSELKAELAAKDAKAPKITGLPDGWQSYGLVQALDDTIEQATRIGQSLYGVNNPAVGRLLGLKRAIKQSEIWKNDAAASFKDSTGKYPGTLRIAKGKSSGLAATPEEIRTIVASVSNFGDKIDMKPGSADFYDMFITPTAGLKDHPIRRARAEIGLMRKTKPETLAYFSEVTGTVYFIDRIRASQAGHNSGETKTDGGANSWWSVEIRPNSSDVLDSTVHHELGHAAADAAGINTTKELGSRPAPSRYGGKNNNEKFAEYMSKYIRTGEAPPWFIDLLRSKGLLKSQQN